MLNNIVCILTNMFGVYLHWKFVRLFFDGAETDRRKVLAACGIYFVCNTGLFLIFHLSWMNIISSTLGTLLLVLVYTRVVKTILFVTGIVSVMSAACDSIAVLPFVDYAEGNDFNQIYIVIANLLLFICFLAADKIMNYYKNKEAVQSLPLVLLPACSIVLLLFLAYSSAEKHIQIAVFSVGLLLINFLVLYLYNLLLGTLSQKYEKEILQQKVDAYAHQMDVILESDREVRSLKHDLKHHLNEIKLMAANKNVPEIQEYINHMESFVQNPYEIVFSGNREMDSILNYLLQKARDTLKTVDINVKLPEETAHSFDINVILGNLLENAIEAAQNTEEKYLSVRIVLERGILRIEVKNSYSENLITGSRGLLTTKADKENHGIGLSNVRKVVQKYNGIMDISSANQIFSIKILLYV